MAVYIGSIVQIYNQLFDMTVTFFILRYYNILTGYLYNIDGTNKDSKNQRHFVTQKYNTSFG